MTNYFVRICNQGRAVFKSAQIHSRFGYLLDHQLGDALTIPLVIEPNTVDPHYKTDRQADIVGDNMHQTITPVLLNAQNTNQRKMMCAS